MGWTCGEAIETKTINYPHPVFGCTVSCTSLEAEITARLLVDREELGQEDTRRDGQKNDPDRGRYRSLRRRIRTHAPRKHIRQGATLRAH